NANELIQVRQGNQITFQRFRPLFRLAQFKTGAAKNDFASVFDIRLVSNFEWQQFWPAVIDRQHVHSEGRFHRGVLVEIVNYDFRISVALQLDYHPGVFVRFVTDRGDVGKNFVVHQLRDALDQGCAIDVVRNFRDHDLLAIAFELLYAGFAAHFHAAVSGLEILANAGCTQDGAARRKIRALHELHQAIKSDIRVVDLRADGVNNFAKIVRRNVCGHADGVAGPAVDQKIRKRAGKNRRLS